MTKLPPLPNIEISSEDGGASADYRPSLENTESIIRACVLSHRVVTAAKDLIDEMDLFRSGRHWFAEVWAVVRDHMLEYNRIPSHVDLIVEKLNYRREHGEFCDYLADDVKARLVKWTADGYSLDYSTETDILLRIDDIWHKYMKRKLHDVGTKAVHDSYSRDELVQELGVVHDKLSSRASVYCAPTNPWREMEDKDLSADKLIPYNVRKPTGVPPLDDLTGGGPLPGEMITFIIPSKVGKTTLGLQLSNNACLRHERVAYHSSEQAMKGDLTLRMFVHVYGKPRSFWKHRSIQATIDALMKDLTDRAAQGDAEAIIELQNIFTRKQAWKEYFDFHDEWRSKVRFKSASDFFDPIFRSKEERGEDHRYLILDWWGKFKDQYCSTAKGDEQYVMKARQSELLSTIKGYTEEAVDRGIPLTTIILHQLSGAAAERSNGPQNQSSHAAQGDKDYNNLFDFASAAGGKYPLKEDKTYPRVNFNHACSRSAEGGSSVYRLDGPNCVFLSEDPEQLKKYLKQEQEKEERKHSVLTKKDRSCGARRAG